MAKKLKKIISAFFNNLLARWLEDIFILAGTIVVIGTTYAAFGSTVGNYTLGITLIVFGLLIARK